MTGKHNCKCDFKKDKGETGLAELESRWQYIMLATAIFVAVIFCFYYILMQSRWGFYSTGRNSAEAKAREVQTETVDVKRAYLTFDDGPSRSTGEILDILDTYGVKATFFVIGRDSSYYDTYREIEGRGHTLALHSYSHDYERVYASADDFAEDVEELRKLLYDVTGVDCVYYRFPGGSSNTVSRTDMSELIDYINSHGMTYFDWNALNGDAVSGSYTPQELVESIMKDAVMYDDVIILMHDLDARHTTVESLPLLIETLTEEGYSLLAIDEDTPLIQHKRN